MDKWKRLEQIRPPGGAVLVLKYTQTGTNPGQTHVVVVYHVNIVAMDMGCLRNFSLVVIVHGVQGFHLDPFGNVGGSREAQE